MAKDDWITTTVAAEILAASENITGPVGDVNLN
jgi:hypothetical protein